MNREDTAFQILDFLTEGEMPFETLCDEMGRYHPQVTRTDISETMDYLLEENFIRVSGELGRIEDPGVPIKWHGLTGKGKEYYYKLAKRRYPED